MTEQLVDFETAKLAREKGFDWIVRHMWHRKGDGFRPIDPPASHETIGRFAEMLEKYQGALKDFFKKLNLKDARPLRNPTLPIYLIARPTQDLLERWLREVHGMVPMIETFIAGPEPWQTGWIFYGTEYINTMKDEVRPDEALDFATFELAREAAIIHALKLLPDASR